jgi:transposase
MLNIGTTAKIMIHREPVDMRKSIDGLSYIVAEEFKSNPADGAVYVFFNKQRDKLKLLYWDRNGFCMWYKRLEKERFKIPEVKDAVFEISGENLRWLMDGLDMDKIRGFKRLKYQQFY